MNVFGSATAPVAIPEMSFPICIKLQTREGVNSTNGPILMMGFNLLKTSFPETASESNSMDGINKSNSLFEVPGPSWH